MSPLLVPLFAQLIGLQLEDRTEGRFVKYGEQRYEGSTAPSAGVVVTDRQSDFSLHYSPTLTLLPLERAPRELLVLHQGALSAQYRLHRTTLTLNSNFSAGDVNFKVAGLQGQLTPTTLMNTTDTGNTSTNVNGNGMGTTGTPTMTDTGKTPAQTTTIPNANAASGQLQVVDRTVRYYATTTAATIAHELSKYARLSAQVGDTRASGLNAASRVFYPPLNGIFVGGTAAYTFQPSAREAFTTNASLVKTWSSNLNQTATLNATETWGHTFDKRTIGGLAAGVNVTRFSQADGLAGFSIFPTFTLSFAHQERIGRGLLTFSTTAFSTPALDPLRALVDPRVGAGGTINYTRRRLTLLATGTKTISVAPAGNNAGAINAAQGEARASYRIGEVAEVDTGARYAKQAFQGVTVIPSSWAVFVGMTFGYDVQLSGDRKK